MRRWTMLNILSQLIEWIMPQYDHTKYVVPLPQERKIPKGAKPKLPDNVLYDKAFQNLVRQEWDNDKSSFELTVYKVTDKNHDKFTDELNDIDFALIQERSLDAIKAIRLKPLWAKGLSSQVVSEDLSRNERGYSWAELKKYWSVFNEAAKVEEDTEKGGKPLPRRVKVAKRKPIG